MKLLRLCFGWLCVCGLLGIGTANAIAADQSAASQAVNQQININTADVQALAALNGLGEKKAQAIIDYRTKHGNFASVDDLIKVKGIGPKLLANLKKLHPNMIVAE